MMVKSISILTMFFFLGSLNAQKNMHSTWENLLKKHVAENGDVNYKSFKSDADALNGYLNDMASNHPVKGWNKNEELAYYINLYNAATVKLILNNYPLKSIKDIKNPWSKKEVWIGGKKWSLGGIEHKILRKMGEPRIHFAINCASYSCPKLINEAYNASKLENQLQKATIDFLIDSSKNILSEKKIQLSKIFKWYEKDFTKKGSLVDYINSYSKKKISQNSEIEYLEYNWTLNEKK